MWKQGTPDTHPQPFSKPVITKIVKSTSLFYYIYNICELNKCCRYIVLNKKYNNLKSQVGLLLQEGKFELCFFELCRHQLFLQCQQSHFCLVLFSQQLQLLIQVCLTGIGNASVCVSHTLVTRTAWGLRCWCWCSFLYETVTQYTISNIMHNKRKKKTDVRYHDIVLITV